MKRLIKAKHRTIVYLRALRSVRGIVKRYQVDRLPEDQTEKERQEELVRRILYGTREIILEGGEYDGWEWELGLSNIVTKDTTRVRYTPESR